MGSADWHSAILCVRLSTQSVCRRRIETTVLAAHWHGPSGSWVPSNPLFATYARRVQNMDLPDSLVWVVLAVVVTLTTFFVSAISLAFRGKSSLATFSSFLFWPYWLLIALLFLDPHFDEDLLAASLCFVCFVSAIRICRRRTRPLPKDRSRRGPCRYHRTSVDLYQRSARKHLLERMDSVQRSRPRGT